MSNESNESYESYERKDDPKDNDDVQGHRLVNESNEEADVEAHVLESNEMTE